MKAGRYRLEMEGDFPGAPTQDSSRGCVNFASTGEDILTLLRLLTQGAMYDLTFPLNNFTMSIKVTKEE